MGLSLETAFSINSTSSDKLNGRDWTTGAGFVLSVRMKAALVEGLD